MIQATNDVYDLERFVAAQHAVYERVRGELAAGNKRSHWMWFIFPQIAGLGSSSMAQRYAISGIEEARAYLEHPLLGPRLRECTGLVNAVMNQTLGQIFGYPDDLKFHSSITLFARAAAGDDNHFAETLTQWFAGAEDAATLQRIKGNVPGKRWLQLD